MEEVKEAAVTVEEFCAALVGEGVELRAAFVWWEKKQGKYAAPPSEFAQDYKAFKHAPA